MRRTSISRRTVPRPALSAPVKPDEEQNPPASLHFANGQKIIQGNPVLGGGRQPSGPTYQCVKLHSYVGEDGRRITTGYNSARSIQNTNPFTRRLRKGL